MLHCIIEFLNHANFFVPLCQEYKLIWACLSFYVIHVVLPGNLILSSNAFACKDHYFPCTNMVITLLAHAVVVHGVPPDELRDVKLQPVGAVTPG